MGSKIIPCTDCAEEKKNIEKSGGRKVISCEVLEDDKDKPKNQQRCEIKWKAKGF